MPGPPRALSTETIPMGVRIALFLLVMWTVSQVLAVIPSLPDALRRFAVQTKVLVGPVVLLLIAMLNARRLRLPKIYLGFYVLSAYSIVNLLFQPEPKWALAILFALWTSCFVLIPALLNTQARLDTFVRWNLITLSLSLIVLLVLGFQEGNYIGVGRTRTRAHFGVNPNYLAAISSSLSFMGLSCRVLMPGRHKVLSWLAIVGGIYLTIMTNSRTQLLGTFFFFAVYALHLDGWKRLLANVALWGITLLTCILLMFWTTGVLSTERVNQISSGRVLVWYSLMRSNFSEGELRPILFGLKGDIEFDHSLANWRNLGYDREDAFVSRTKAKASFRRVSFDNSYIDIFVTTGLVGLFLALWAWTQWWRSLGHRRRANTIRRRKVGLAKGLIVSLLISALFAPAWPGIGSVAVSFVLVMAIALTHPFDDPAQSASLSSELSSEHRSGPPLNASWLPPGRIR